MIHSLNYLVLFLILPKLLVIFSDPGQVHCSEKVRNFSSLNNFSSFSSTSFEIIFLLENSSIPFSSFSNCDTCTHIQLLLIFFKRNAPNRKLYLSKIELLPSLHFFFFSLSFISLPLYY